MAILFNALALFFAVITASIYWYGADQSFFWIYDWYDSMLHVLGGLTLGFWAGAVAVRLHVSSRHAFFLIVALTFFGAIAWELFEYVFGFVREAAYVLDTTMDITNSVVGGVFAFIGFWLLVSNFKRHGE